MSSREPRETRSGYCSECKNACDGKWIDVGIGSYEFWGQRCNDTQWVEVSNCCEGDIVDFFEEDNDVDEQVSQEAE